MRRLSKRKDGQFVIIAAVIVALMMISLSTLLHEAATYYTHEPWDEYVGLIGNIELNFNRLVEISLANYTMNQTDTILDQNLAQWQNDLSEIYIGQGVYADYSLSGTGLSKMWGCRNSYSKANAQLSIEISSIGLKGYQILSEASLKVEVQPLPGDSDQVELLVTKENNALVYGLTEENFAITSNPTVNIIRVDEHYDEANVLVYTITCNAVVPDNFLVEVYDQRGIAVTCGPSETPLPSSSPVPSSSPSPTPSPSPSSSPTPSPPPSQTALIYPVDDGDILELRKNGANKNWKCADDNPEDSDSTYLNTFSTTYRTDTYITQDINFTGIINYVKVYVTCRYTWVGTGGETCTVLKTLSGTYFGNNVPLTTSYVTTSTTYTSNPAGGNWTWADIISLQCGVSLRAAGGAEARCTQVYVEVNYTP